MNTYLKVIATVIVSVFGCAYADEQMAPEVEQEVVAQEQKEQPEAPVQTAAPAAVVDDSQENLELEKYLQELSQEFDQADTKS